MIVQPFRSIGKIITGKDPYRGLNSFEGTRCFVIISNSILNNHDVYEKISRNLKVTSIMLSSAKITGEPTVDSLCELIREIEEFNPDCIIAVGGGGIIDAAKAARVIFEYPEYYSKIKSERLIPVNKLHKTQMVVVPSTIGTGSESSSSAVIKNSDGEKSFIICHDLIADSAIIDPNIVSTLPRHLKISTMCDAISHAVESYVSTLTNGIIQSHSAWALRTIFLHWRSVLGRDVSMNSYESLLLASLYAGYSQNNGLVGGAHALAHAYSKYGLSHGVGNALFLPGVIKVNAQNENTDRMYARLSNESGIGNSSAELIEFVNQLKNELNHPKPHPQLSDLDLEKAVNDPGGRANPIPLSRKYFDSVLSGML